MTRSSWKVCLWARTGKVQAGLVSDPAHTTILAREVAEAWLYSFYLVAELRTMLSRESRSLRAYDIAGLFQ